MSFKTEQEDFWAGDFGNEYITRNQGAKAIASNLNFFSKSLNQARGVKSCIEFGANIGLNLSALSLLFPGIDAHAVEINSEACEHLKEVIPPPNIYNKSILDFLPEQKYDLVLIKGVLIHINPDQLKNVYEKLVLSTSRYLMVAEYYNPSPTTVTYRGHNDRLFKRDFAGEILDQFPGLQLVDYGFAYHRDPNFPQDDITWFLLEQKNAG
jgi:spore coat polysaccharide biosynthesis protein SpsF